jgi:uncharacterized protein (TIGR02284 family)
MTSVSEQNPNAAVSDASAKEVRALNGLIVSVLDNVDECRRAVFALEQHVATLQRRLYSRMQAVEQLQSRVREMGAEPANTHSTLAEAFAMLLAIREPFTRNRKEDLLQDVERGEQALKVQFRHCLSAPSLSAATRDCVNNALDCVVSETNRKSDGWSSQYEASVPPLPLPPTLTASFEVHS